MRYLDPKNDLTFKKIFGTHKHLCMSLLNSLLPLDEGQEITEIEYLTPEMVPDIPMQKNSIVDVRCKDNQQRIFIVEMQMDWTESFKQRVLFNASKAYVRQLEKGEDYKLLHPVYLLSFVNDILEKDVEQYYHHYKIVNLEHSHKVIEGLQFVFVELPKFRAKNITDRKMQILWLRFLAESERDKRDIPQELFENQYTQEALEHLEESSYSTKELVYYDKFLDTIRTERTRIADAMELGKTEGELVGLQKGKQIGLEEGKREGKREVALLLKKGNVPIEIIIQSTDLSKKEIEEL